MESNLSDYKTEVHNDWCPGCGDFGIVSAIQMALAEMEIPRHKAALFSGIGAGHVVAAGRRNVDMTYIIFNNGVYGLTKGQASPTLKLGLQTKSLPEPNVNQAVNPIALAVASGFTFVARGYAYDVRQLKDLIIAAVKHRGLAFLDVLQPCPTYNDINTRDWFSGMDNIDEMTKKPRPRIYKLEDTHFDPVVHIDSPDEENEKLTQALIKSNEWDMKI